ncbi:hypothetical protein, conserved [Leishmania donovani]|uniref:Cytidylyltransferase family protein n=1 Tax=Leishmania donovani TaxID=5661 RepID=A0A3Q8IFJ1_LEIDO|nr:hypothetical protein, conserved [Leishmania donovani]AYU81765.1 Cytidylyltransferase, putative [Leishmania donovani]TPP43729.1 Cytidylyltransferase family protein [Leishmania donovani]CBZ36950.1 hypothetical protein, conserved [Leishmania donovani]
MTPLVLLSTSRGKDANAKSLAAYLTRSVLTPIATKAATAAGSVSAASEPIKYRCSSTELQCGYSGGVDVYLAIDNQHRSTFLEHSVHLYSAALEVCPQLSISIIPVIRTAEAATCGTASKEETHAPAASPSPSARSKQQQQFDGVQRGGSDVIELYDDAAAVLREWKLVDKAFMRDAEGFKPHYKYVAVGGTFDHFHSGHKVLLSTAALHAIQKLRVGVTDASLLTRKKFAESLQSIELRMENVAQFLQKMRPDLELELEPISEISGGTKSIPDVEALVVSPETAKSLGLINEMRSANGGLAPMVGISIPLVESPTGELISSTALRERQTQAD